jgi:acyl-CoA thioesterase-1
VVLETGANDGLRGQEVDSLRSNLLTIIARIRQDLPADRILLVGMEALPNLGPQYTTRFRQVYPDVVRQTGVRFLPFLLEGVAGVDSLNQTDGIHPSPRGHAQVADHLWPALEAMLREEGS